MSDGIRPVDRESWIPQPREVVRPRKRKGEEGQRERDQHAFEEELGSSKSLRPLARRRDASMRVDDHAQRVTGGEEGLGEDLDLLA